MTEDESIAASEAAVQENLAALENKDRIAYYISQQQQEKAYEYLFDDNITLFGQDVMHVSLDDMVSIGNDQGWNIGRLNVQRYDGVPYTYVTRNLSGEGCQSSKVQLYFYGPEYQLWGYHIMNTY